LAGFVALGLVAGVVDVVIAPRIREEHRHRRQAAWQYDVALDGETRALVDQLLREPDVSQQAEHDAWRETTLELGSRTFRRIGEMPTANRAWRELAIAYVDIYEDMLGAIERMDPVPIQELNRRRTAADARLLELRKRYSQHS
jgi:hypothetical protein